MDGQFSYFRLLPISLQLVCCALYRCTYVANLKNDFHHYTLVEDFVNTTYERRHTAKLPLLHNTVATAPSATCAAAASHGTTRHTGTVHTTAQYNHYSTWFFNSKYYYSVTQHISRCIHHMYIRVCNLKQVKLTNIHILHIANSERILIQIPFIMPLALWFLMIK